MRLGKNLAELESVLFASELKISGDKDEHTTGGTRRLTIDGGDVMLALLEREAGELSDDVLRALDLLAFEGQHGTFLVERNQTWTISIEGGVVVLNESLRNCVWIHLLSSSFDSFALPVVLSREERDDHRY